MASGTPFACILERLYTATGALTVSKMHQNKEAI
jgi:hypothetical protein